LTNPLGSKTRISLSRFTCRMEALEWRTWALMISIFYLEWLRYGWFSISLFMDFDSPYCSVTSSLTLWAFSYSPYAYLKCEIALVLTQSRSMYYNCSILHLISYAAWFVHRLWSAPVGLCLLLAWLNLFATCGVHWSDYTCFLCVLIYSPLCVIMPWLWPMFVPSWFLSPV
jgi:hypothetical protein